MLTQWNCFVHTQVLFHEMRAIQLACSKWRKDYQPAITFIVVQKRHHARFIVTDSTDAVSCFYVLCIFMWKKCVKMIDAWQSFRNSVYVFASFLSLLEKGVNIVNFQSLIIQGKLFPELQSNCWSEFCGYCFTFCSFLIVSHLRSQRLCWFNVSAEITVHDW